MTSFLFLPESFPVVLAGTAHTHLPHRNIGFVCHCPIDYMLAFSGLKGSHDDGF